MSDSAAIPSSAPPARPKVFVSGLIPEAGLSLLRESCDVDVWSETTPPPRETLLARSRDRDGVLTLLSERVDAEFLDHAPNVRVVSNYAVGYNNIDVPACTARGIVVGNTPGVLTDATADMAVTLLLAAARCLKPASEFARSGDWKCWLPRGFLGQDLQGKTLGVVGLGRIGAAVAKRLRGGWDMRVIYNNRSRNVELEREVDAEFVDFYDLLPRADFVTLHADLNASTRGLFNADAFRKMKPSAVFVNTSRGGLVVQSDLVKALQEGWIFAAGLDVTDPEPPDPADPILHLPNCVVAPHVGSATNPTRDRMATMAAENLLAGLAGRPLPAWINPDAGLAGRRSPGG